MKRCQNGMVSRNHLTLIKTRKRNITMKQTHPFKNTRTLVTIAMIAAIYTVLTLVIAPISYGSVQFRVSEMMTVLPAFTPIAIPGLTLGCALANLLGALLGLNPTGYIDAVVGSLASLMAAACSYGVSKYTKKLWVKLLLVPLFPVVFNAFIVGAELTFLFAADQAFFTAFWPFVISVGVGQLVVCYGLGVPLMLALNRGDLHKKIFAH